MVRYCCVDYPVNILIGNVKACLFLGGTICHLSDAPLNHNGNISTKVSLCSFELTNRLINKALFRVVLTWYMSSNFFQRAYGVDDVAYTWLVMWDNSAIFVDVANDVACLQPLAAGAVHDCSSNILWVCEQWRPTSLMATRLAFMKV
ncbi:hypothetical protein FNV43_RR07985 [Rhamnella rubrinervis]|uniref:Uncharacterized protein n=1 Tax=Rhamnella rubrinervis TaxID=2594499 RepID=A0A8K0HHM1_9ROSA|nr:hypothetical protein FNV43_RR07985 [Rhamnella rubrinervis]